MAPPLGFPRAPPGLGARTELSRLGVPSSSPPVASPVTSQLQAEWRMRRLLRQELEKGWKQPEAQYITPEMISTGLQMSTEAAHQAAAAWQQEQAYLTWQAQANCGIQAPPQLSPLLGGAAGSPEALYAALAGAPPMPPLPRAGSFGPPEASWLEAPRQPSSLLGSATGTPEALHAA